MFCFFFYLQTQNNNSTRYKLQAWLRFIAHCSLCTHISYVAFKHHIQRFYLPHVVTQIINSIQPKVDSQEHICKTNKSLDMPSFHANLGWKQWAKCIKIKCEVVWFYTHHNSIIKIYQYARQIQSMHHQQALDSFQSVNVLIKIKKENPSHTVIMFYLAKL